MPVFTRARLYGAVIFCLFFTTGMVAGSLGNNYYCKGCATVMEQTWFTAMPLVDRARRGVEGGIQADVAVDIENEVVKNICGNQFNRFQITHPLRYNKAIRDSCSQITSKNADVVATGFYGTFPDAYELYLRIGEVCVAQMDLCDPPLEGTFANLDECSRCKIVINDMQGTLTKAKGSNEYLSAKHVWNMLENECQLLPSRYPKTTALELQETCEQLLEDYDSLIAESFKARDKQPGKMVCGSTGANMCSKKLPVNNQSWDHDYTSPWLLEGPPAVGNMHPYEL
jgi:hypothetical protein